MSFQLTPFFIGVLHFQPEYNMFLEELEHFLIRTFASTLKNQLDIEPIIDSKIELVNRQLKKNKI